MTLEDSTEQITPKLRSAYNAVTLMYVCTFVQREICGRSTNKNCQLIQEA